MKQVIFDGPPLIDVLPQQFRCIRISGNEVLISTARREYMFRTVRARAVLRVFMADDIGLSKAAELVGATDLAHVAGGVSVCDDIIMQDNTDVGGNWMRVESLAWLDHHPTKSLQVIFEVEGGVVVEFGAHAYRLKMPGRTIDALRAVLVAPGGALPSHITSRPASGYWRTPLMPRFHVDEIQSVKPGSISARDSRSVLMDFTRHPDRKMYREEPALSGKPEHPVHKKPHFPR
jgi:hypothetical protein